MRRFYSVPTALKIGYQISQGSQTGFHCNAENELELMIPVFTSQVLGLQVCTTILPLYSNWGLDPQPPECTLPKDRSPTSLLSFQAFLTLNPCIRRHHEFVSESVSPTLFCFRTPRIYSYLILNFKQGSWGGGLLWLREFSYGSWLLSGRGSYFNQREKASLCVIVGSSSKDLSAILWTGLIWAAISEEWSGT